MPEWRTLAIGPHAAPVRHDDQQTSIVLQHTPGLPQQTPGIFRHLQPMHEQDLVESQVSERQAVLFGGAGQVGDARGPARGSHLRRGQSDAPRRLITPKTQIRHRISNAQHRLSRRRWPHRHQSFAQYPCGHGAPCRSVEFRDKMCVGRHNRSITRPAVSDRMNEC